MQLDAIQRPTSLNRSGTAIRLTNVGAADRLCRNKKLMRSSPRRRWRRCSETCRTARIRKPSGNFSSSSIRERECLTFGFHLASLGGSNLGDELHAVILPQIADESSAMNTTPPRLSRSLERLSRRCLFRPWLANAGPDCAARVTIQWSDNSCPR
jgi:hypothetical protein